MEYQVRSSTPDTTCSSPDCARVATVILTETDGWGYERKDELCRWCALDASQQAAAPRSVDDAIHSISDQSAAERAERVLEYEAKAAAEKAEYEAKAAAEKAEYEAMEAEYAAERAAAAEAKAAAENKSDEEARQDDQWDFLRAIMAGHTGKVLPEERPAPAGKEPIDDDEEFPIAGFASAQSLVRGQWQKAERYILKAWNEDRYIRKGYRRPWRDGEGYGLAITQPKKRREGPWQTACTIYRQTTEDGSFIYDVRPQPGEIGESVRGRELGPALTKFARSAERAAIERTNREVLEMQAASPW